MPPALRLVAGLTLLTLLDVPGLHAQHDNPATAGPFRLYPTAEEVALARSAAPAAVSDSATIYVLRGTGFEKVVTGTNGVSCLVSRDHPESLYPICYDREASRTIMPVELFEVVQRIAGMPEEQITAEIDRHMERGEFPSPARGALTWMMSPRQVLYAGATGPRAGRWHPHVMIYIPGATPAELGVAGLAPTGDFQVALPGTPRAHLIIQTVVWSDGSPHIR
jgi:hypothetical protein